MPKTFHTLTQYAARTLTHIWFVVGIALLAGFLCGFWIGRPDTSDLIGDAQTREGGYQFINPLLSCDVSDDVVSVEFTSFQKALQKQADQLVHEGKAKRISVYFRDMNHGYWTGVRADDTFVPASLMKVPLLIAYLKNSEGHVGFLETTLPIAKTDDNARESIKSTTTLAPGKSYTRQSLLQTMIVGSDNNAANALAANVDGNVLNDVYANFAIPPAFDENQDVMSPKIYMRLFRILYNGSYLWKADSSHALEMLSSTEFKDGLVAGVPSGTTIAHKFGERVVHVVNQSGVEISHVSELHDCGIVYYPKMPYGMCVMTEGDDIGVLKEVISTLSKTAYDEVDEGLLGKPNN